MLDKKQIQKLGLIIFTHLLKLIKAIADSNTNHLNIQEWDRFKKSKKFMNTILTIKEYSIRYEK